MERYTRLAGTIAFLLGLTSALLTGLYLLSPVTIVMFSALICGMLGFVISCLYIILNQRFPVSQHIITPGMFGLLLSSAPVIYILIMNILTKK
ncbi:MAG: hypothetical protein ACHQRM_09995 [Bacteroidia bacterium]